LAEFALHSVQASLELEALEGVPLPDPAAYVWDAFLELSSHRASSGFGPSPLSWLDLDAWQRVTGTTMTALERSWIFELDRMFIEDQAGEQRRRSKK
jgi:hypothetical protein